MLFNATVSGIPEFNKLASCWVNVASSCNFGLRFCCNCARNAGGKNAVKSTSLLARFAFGGRAGPRCVHGNREQSETLDLRQRRRTVRHFQNAFDQFAGTAPGLV